MDGMPSFRGKELVIFDLDGTLTPSKAAMRKDMARALLQLLLKKRVAVIGGGSYEQFKHQFIKKARLPGRLLEHLFLFPVSGTAFYRYVGGRWKKVYAKHFSATEKKRYGLLSGKHSAGPDTGTPKKHTGKSLKTAAARSPFPRWDRMWFQCSASAGGWR